MIALISRWLAVAIAAMVGVAFGVHDAAAKMWMEDVDPELLSFSTLLVGLPLLLAMLPMAGGLRVTPLAAAYFVVAGVINFAVGRTLMYVATSLLTASGASVMTSSSAAFSILLAALLGEPVRPVTVLGVAAIMAAVYLASDWRGSRAPARGLATGLAVGLAIAASVAVIKLGDEAGGSPALGVVIAYASGMAALASRVRGLRPLARSRPGPLALMGLSAAAGQLMRYVALTVLSVDVVTPLQNIRPIVATLVLGSAASASRRPRAVHWAAAALAFAGVALVSGLVRL